METSTSNKVLLAVLVLMIAGSAAGSHDSTSAGEFAVPDYESHYEIATQLFAPFLLTTVILQIALETTLRVTLMPNNPRSSPWNLGSGEQKYRKKRIKRVSTVSALAIAGMLVPTNFYTLLSATTLVTLGGSTLLFVIIPFLVLFWLLLIKPAGN